MLGFYVDVLFSLLQSKINNSNCHYAPWKYIPDCYEINLFTHRSNCHRRCCSKIFERVLTFDDAIYNEKAPPTSLLMQFLSLLISTY